MESLPPNNGPIQWPAIWTEEWLQIAIDELEKLDLTPEERLRYEMTLSVSAVIVRKADRQLREAEERAEMRVKEEAISKGLHAGLAVELIAKLNDSSVSFVREIEARFNNESSKRVSN